VRKIQIFIGMVCLVLSLFGFTREGRGQNENVGKSTEAKWEKYDWDMNGVEYFYDKESISYPSATTLQVRRQRVFPSGASYRNIVTVDQIDCDKGKYRYISIEVTNKDGSTEEFLKASQWAYISVGMPEDYFLREYCK